MKERREYLPVPADHEETVLLKEGEYNYKIKQQ